MGYVSQNASLLENPVPLKIMIKFTNVSVCAVLETRRESETQFESVAYGLNHFNMFILGRKNVKLNIVSITSTEVVVHEESVIGTSDMTYSGTQEEMLIISVLAAQKFCQDNQAAASVAMKSVLTQAQVPA